MDGIDKNRRRLRKWGVTGKVIGVTPVRNNLERGHEIQEWLDSHSGIESFVIIDDDKDMAHLLPRLVHTPFATGLEECHADAAIAMLAGELVRHAPPQDQ